MIFFHIQKRLKRQNLKVLLLNLQFQKSQYEKEKTSTSQNSTSFNSPHEYPMIAIYFIHAHNLDPIVIESETKEKKRKREKDDVNHGEKKKRRLDEEVSIYLDQYQIHI